MTAVLESIADRIDSLTPTHPVRVAVDGPDASGKTILADTLSSMMVRRDRDVIRASIDGFHLPREQRYRRGQDSRYIPGQEIYFRTARPWTLADIVLDNSDPDSPVILSAVSPPGGASARPSATPTVRAPEPQ
jgi:uridine kinase